MSIAWFAGEVLTSDSSFIIDDSLLINFEVVRNIECTTIVNLTTAVLLVQFFCVVVQGGVVGNINLQVIDEVVHVEVQRRTWQQIDAGFVDGFFIVYIQCNIARHIKRMRICPPMDGIRTGG